MKPFETKRSLLFIFYLSIFLFQTIHLSARDITFNNGIIITDTDKDNANLGGAHDINPEFDWSFGMHPYTVTINNVLPDDTGPLRVHCASKDDELGFHDLRFNESMSWHFRMNFWGKTLYFCHFWWGEKDKAFVIFDKPFAENFCGEDQEHNDCRWFVEEDGFYFTKLGFASPSYPRYLKKLQDW